MSNVKKSNSVSYSTLTAQITEELQPMSLLTSHQLTQHAVQKFHLLCAKQLGAERSAATFVLMPS